MDPEAHGEPAGPTRTVRRSARAPAKVPAKTPASAAAAAPQDSPAKGKRKAREPIEKTPEEKLEYLLTNSKSKLTNVDISVRLSTAFRGSTESHDTSIGRDQLRELLGAPGGRAESPLCPAPSDSILYIYGFGLLDTSR